MEQLLTKLKDAGLIDGLGYIVLEVGGQVVDVETFNGFFGATNLTYTALKAADGGKGYTRFFDEWKSKGII